MRVHVSIVRRLLRRMSENRVEETGAQARVQTGDNIRLPHRQGGPLTTEKFKANQAAIICSANKYLKDEATLDSFLYGRSSGRQ